MDTQVLTEHLRNTPFIIQQLRALMNPNDYRYSDEETISQCTFGPKSPTNDCYIDFADHEAALIGNMTRYCMAAGSIPTIPLKGFWAIAGTCIGMRTNGLPGVRTACRHLIEHIDCVINTEGIEDLLAEMVAVRKVSLSLIPNENTNWMTMEEAIKFTGRSKSQIYKWLQAGGIQTLDDRWGLMISRVDLQTKMAIIYASRLAAMKKARESNHRNIKPQVEQQ